MDKKVILVSVDGMRPDGFESCGSFCIEKLKRECAYTLRGRSVMPSVTLPCHMTMFHGVAPERHGITTNLYMPQVRPVEGLCERLRAAGKTCAFFYNWHELRDLVRPGSLAYSVFFQYVSDFRTGSESYGCGGALYRRKPAGFRFCVFG